jgi:hypothetical protein
MAGVDQSQLMLIAQEVVSGRHQYTELFDIQPPPSVYLHAAPIIAFRWLGWPIVFSWNLYVTILCGISASLFALRTDTKSPVVLMCLWFGAVLLVFDDALFGQRDFLFSLFWFPYLVARLGGPAPRLAAVDVLCGVLLSIIVCARPSLVVYVVLIDLPIFIFLPRKEQSHTALCALVAGGLAQAASFFLFHPLGQYLWIADKLKLRDMLGTDYGQVLSYLLHASEVYVPVGVIALLIGLNLWAGRQLRCVIACAATIAVALVIAVSYGGFRSYTLIPVILASLAASLQEAFSDGADTAKRMPAHIAPFRHAVVIGLCVAAAVPTFLIDGGMVRSLLLKYVWNQPDAARIGPLPDDEYMSWVKGHVRDDEYVAVIALQYGYSAAFDPLLSTLRLGRRVKSYSPILEVPLRAALVSGNRERIDEAWDLLISEISASNADWIVVRRTTPVAALGPDFVDLMEREPRFYSWLTAHYSQYASFGPYVAYRRKV